MDKDLKDKWVAALRSGKYKQGRNHLRDCNDNYCCLGVLAEVSGEEWSAGSYTTHQGKIVHKLARTGSIAIYSVPGMKWSPYSILNDGDGLTFEQIADWIEENQDVTLSQG